MSDPATREELIAWARDTISAGSQSFAAASALFPERERDNAWLLYAWCRACDDLTDDQHLGHAIEASGKGNGQSADLRALTHLALEGEGPVPPPFAALREVCRDTPLPPEFIFDHLRGFDLDKAGWRPQDTDDLLAYCYHVAGAVGLMMAIIMGVDPRDRDTLDRAADLGLAFQLHNIARDLRDDADNGRCYIPAQWLREARLRESDLSCPFAISSLTQFARRLHDLALDYEASARVGAARLSPRCRFVILWAARIYGAIGREVVARGDDAWKARVSTSKGRKLREGGVALLQCLAAPNAPRKNGLFDYAKYRASLQ